MKFVILHGSFGHIEDNWFPWLKEQLEALDQEVILPQMPIDTKELGAVDDYQEPREQYLDNWVSYFKQNVIPLVGEEPVAIIAHSISNVFTLHLCEQLELEIEMAVFVAPFLTLPSLDKPYDLVNASFYSEDFDFKKVSNLVKKSYVLYSDNDASVPIENALTFAEKITASPILVNGGGHMYTGTGFTKFPLILELCKAHLGLANKS